MKTKELIDKLNERMDVEAKTTMATITIWVIHFDGECRSNKTVLARVPFDATEWLDCEITSTPVEPMTKSVINELVGDYLVTPVDERKEEKRYRLLWMDGRYFEKWDDSNAINMQKWDLTYDLDFAAVFTESALNSLKQAYPRWAPAIDCTKEEVDGDD